MSAAIHSVRTIRNSVLESNLSLREQSPAERDEVRRSETVSESIESLITPLTARQMHAINLLAMGKTVVATARSLDIGVSTLHRWKATHPLFKAELAQRQHNLFDAMIQKLRLTMSKAVDNLFEMMNSTMKSERKEVTHAMLKQLRPQKFLVPSEPMSAQAVLDEAVREMRASRGESMSEEITEEERIAAIPAEFRVMGEVKHQGHGGHEECGNGEDETQSRSCAERRHVERSETCGASEREKTAKRVVTTVRRESTPLPSREGPGEGAASDEVGANDERAGDVTTVNPRIADRSKPIEMNRENLANTSHDQLNPATVIAARPLPQPLPRGEGSQSAPRADSSVTAASIIPQSSIHAQSNLKPAIAPRPLPQPLPQGEGSEEGLLANRSVAASDATHSGQIPHAYAQDDGVGGTRHAERSEASGSSEREVAKSESVHAQSGQILREYAQDDGVGETRHAERSEASGCSERQSAISEHAPAADETSAPCITVDLASRPSSLPSPPARPAT